MTFKLLTMMRNGGLVLASGLFFGETITPLEAFGYGGLMVCFGLYTYIKTQMCFPKIYDKILTCPSVKSICIVIKL